MLKYTTHYVLALLLTIYTTQEAHALLLTNPKKNWPAFFSHLQSLYNLNTFVESGTHLGQTTHLAAPFFNTIYTVEITQKYYEHAQEQLKHHDNITLLLGDTAQLFPTIIKKLNQQNKKILFWLDGHFMSSMIGEHDNILQEYGYTPIRHELDAILNNKTTQAIILIDDIRLFGTQLHGKRISAAGNANYPLLSEIIHVLTNHDYICHIYGDMLLAHHTSISLPCSKIIKACTVSRTYDGKNYTLTELLTAEQTIAKATGQELEALYNCYHDFSKPWEDCRKPWKNWRNKSPHYNLWWGLILQQQGKHDQACEQFQQVIDLDYQDQRIYDYLALSKQAIKA